MFVSQEARQEYYCSREWGLKKNAVHQRSGGMCERCLHNKGQAVHHKTYIRFFNEDLDDLVHLCNGCHDFQHGHSNVDPAETIYQTNFIKIDTELFGDDNSVLCCPDCGGNYIHFNEVKTEVDGNISIKFWCEGCNSLSKLRIIESKGNTFLDWEVTTKAQS